MTAEPLQHDLFLGSGLKALGRLCSESTLLAALASSTLQFGLTLFPFSPSAMVLYCSASPLQIQRNSYVKNKPAILAKKKQRYDASVASQRAATAASKNL